MFSFWDDMTFIIVAIIIAAGLSEIKVICGFREEER